MKAILPPLMLLFGMVLNSPVPVRVTFSPLTKAAYLAAKKMAVSTTPTLIFPLKKVRGRIVVPTAKGPKVFQDITEEIDNQEQFDYLGYDSQFRYHLVQDQFWGGYWGWHKFHLIGENGQHLALPGIPIYSPDMCQIVTASDGTDTGHSTVSIQLYRLDNGRWRQVWKVAYAEEVATWATDDIQWLSNSTLLLKKRVWAAKKPENFTYAKLLVH